MIDNATATDIAEGLALALSAYLTLDLNREKIKKLWVNKCLPRLKWGYACIRYSGDLDKVKVLSNWTREEIRKTFLTLTQAGTISEAVNSMLYESYQLRQPKGKADGQT